MKFLKIDPFREPDLVKAIAKVYQLSFGGEPWNEGFICPVCKYTVPLSQAELLCGVCFKNGQHVNLVEYWPLHQVLIDFYKEMNKPKPTCIVAIDDEEIKGFAWGYEVVSSNHLSIHLDAPGLAAVIEGNFFYLDECALSPLAQGKGYGKQLVRYIFSQQGSRNILLRTKCDSRMYHLIRHLGGEAVMRISQDRLIMRLDLA
jgi:ribosomal protein S18 acetylase RimI-like enzyme